MAIPETVSKLPDTGLAALLGLVLATLCADGALVSSGAPGMDASVLASVPSGLAGRRLPVSPALHAVCGSGVQPTEKVLLPSSVTGWLGFRPQYLASCRVSWADGEGCLYFLWKQAPPENPRFAELLEQATRLVGEYTGRQVAAVSQQQVQERLDTILAKVELGIVFVDLLAGSVVNPVAARILELPEETRDTATVAAAIQRVRSQCAVERSETRDGRAEGTAAGEEYWICSSRGIVLRVESHEVGTAQVPGRFWLFTDVKPLWESAEKVKVANQVLERNLSQLNTEMERRMEAEDELRKYTQGLQRQNEELEIAKLHSDLLANQDSLTGLANRRRFRNGLDEMVDHARMSHGKVAVLYLDLDKFKPVNDTLGHERGDELLRKVSDTLTRSLRKDDLIARLGGDEFACALSLDGEMDEAGLEDLVLQVRQRLHIPVSTGSGSIEVSATVGVAVFPEDAEDGVSLLRAADNAMYLGKSRGGNVVNLFSRKRLS